jgi:hypothetical protein
MSSAGRFDKSMGMMMDRNADQWWLIKNEMDY